MQVWKAYLKTMTQKLLLIGPKLTNNTRDIGGTTVLMDLFEKYLKENNVEYKLIESNLYDNEIFNFIYIAIKMFSIVGRVDIVIANAGLNFLRYLSPLLLLVSKVFKKKFILRIFGGRIDIIYEQSYWLEKKIYNFLFWKSDLIFVETLIAKAFLQSRFKTTIEWFPNCRKKNSLEAKEFRKKFIFLGHVKKEKGILEILKVNELDSIKIDIFGPIHDKSIRLDRHYKGIVSPDEVIEKLAEYDVLVLPTYWYGEGYPGVILEAFSLGIPVVSTNYRAIPEIIDDGKNGILVRPKNHKELHDALLGFNTENYSIYSVNAYEKFNKFFDTDNVHKNIFRIMDAVL